MATPFVRVALQVPATLQPSQPPIHQQHLISQPFPIAPATSSRDHECHQFEKKWVLLDGWLGNNCGSVVLRFIPSDTLLLRCPILMVHLHDIAQTHQRLRHHDTTTPSQLCQPLAWISASPELLVAFSQCRLVSRGTMTLESVCCYTRSRVLILGCVVTCVRGMI